MRTLKIAHFLAVLVGCGVVAAATNINDEIDLSPLARLELRALRGQAMMEVLEAKEGRIAELEAELAEAQAKMSNILSEVEAKRQEIAEIKEKASGKKGENEVLRRMLGLFRSGSFEYYEVQEGDTMAAIAANPMVYGDEEREIWLREANEIEEGEEPVAGTILLVPRFPEGFSYEF